MEWECRLVTGFPPNSRRLPLPARLEWGRLQGSRSQGSRARACRSAGAGRKPQRVCEVSCPAPMTAGLARGGPGWRPLQTQAPELVQLGADLFTYGCPPPGTTLIRMTYKRVGVP